LYEKSDRVYRKLLRSAKSGINLFVLKFAISNHGYAYILTDGIESFVGCPAGSKYFLVSLKKQESGYKFRFISDKEIPEYEEPTYEIWGYSIEKKMKWQRLIRRYKLSEIERNNLDPIIKKI
jgi:hypothetical protein